MKAYADASAVSHGTQTNQFSATGGGSEEEEGVLIQFEEEERAKDKPPTYESLLEPPSYDQAMSPLPPPSPISGHGSSNSQLIDHDSDPERAFLLKTPPPLGDGDEDEDKTVALTPSPSISGRGQVQGPSGGGDLVPDGDELVLYDDPLHLPPPPPFA